MAPIRHFARAGSTRIAGLFLAVCVMPAPAAALANPATERLQRLVEAVDLQLHLTLRAQTAKLESLRGELQQALQAWNRSGRTDDDLALMEAWLRGAIRATMPGRPGPTALPPAPDFAAVPIVIDRVTEFDAPTAPPNKSVFAEPAPLAEVVEDLPPPADPEPFDWPQPEPEPLADTPPNQRSEQPAARPQPPTAEEPPLVLERHPAAADLAWGDPFLDDPLPASEAAVRTTRMKPAPGVTIDVAELSARARGYRKGIESIESAVLSAPNASAFRLAGLTREVESLCEQRELVELYLNGAPGAGAAIRQQLISPTGVVDLLQQRADKRRESLRAENPPSADAERAVLAGVERKLEDLAAGARAN